MSSLSKYRHYSHKRLPREKRTLPLYGEKDDTGKLFRCWNCGAICNIERERLTTGEYGLGGVVPTTYTDVDGKTKYYPNVIDGCWFCGSTNWR